MRTDLGLSDIILGLSGPIILKDGVSYLRIVHTLNVRRGIGSPLPKVKGRT